MRKGAEIIGCKFSQLLVIDYAPSIRYKGVLCRIAICKCDCGTVKEIKVQSLLTGNTKSCGCRKIKSLAERSTKHGLRHHPLYPIWLAMLQRCENPNNKRFGDYGGRGITICSEWKKDFISFYDWAMSNGWEDGLQIDRIDNNSGYMPENCRLVSSKVNNNNKRNHILITYKGQTKNLSEWATDLGLNYRMLLTRIIRHNPSPEELFETKNRYWKHKELSI